MIPASAKIRVATAGDLDGVMRADPLASRGDARRAGMLRQCIDGGQCRVSLREGRVTGFVVVKAAHFFGRDFIELLVVDRRCRRAGLGRALLRAAVSSAASDRVFTSTNVSNVAMRSLLEAEGWSFSGQLDGLDEGDAELVFFTALHH